MSIPPQLRWITGNIHFPLFFHAFTVRTNCPCYCLYDQAVSDRSTRKKYYHTHLQAHRHTYSRKHSLSRQIVPAIACMTRPKWSIYRKRKQSDWSTIEPGGDLSQRYININHTTIIHTVLSLKESEHCNKKHSENANTSKSVTFDLEVWPLPFFKVKKADVIICCLLYCTLLPGMMSMCLIFYEI